MPIRVFYVCRALQYSSRGPIEATTLIAIRWTMLPSGPGAEGGASRPTRFERTVPASQAIDNAGGHCHYLLYLIFLVKCDRKKLLDR
jgi:hypothetical protein